MRINLLCIIEIKGHFQMNCALSGKWTNQATKLCCKVKRFQHPFQSVQQKSNIHLLLDRIQVYWNVTHTLVIACPPFLFMIGYGSFLMMSSHVGHKSLWQAFFGHQWFSLFCCCCCLKGISLVKIIQNIWCDWSGNFSLRGITREFHQPFRN